MPGSLPGWTAHGLLVFKSDNMDARYRAPKISTGKFQEASQCTNRTCYNLTAVFMHLLGKGLKSFTCTCTWEYFFEWVQATYQSRQFVFHSSSMSGGSFSARWSCLNVISSRYDLYSQFTAPWEHWFRLKLSRKPPAQMTFQGTQETSLPQNVKGNV